MPVRELPHQPNLEHLRKQAKLLKKQVRAGDQTAVELVREFHPRAAEVLADPSDQPGIGLADAQLVLARGYGFDSWPKLHRHVELLNRYARSPHRPPSDVPASPAEARVAEFLGLACLTYGGDDRARRDRARKMLAADHALARASIHTMAAVGDHAAVASLLADDPGQASRRGGPHGWEPLLYLAYSRLDTTAPEHSALEAARLLLANGADPNAGYLWDGAYAFTALTGVLGEGEDAINQPRHQFWLPLARLLLEAGADPNDSQGLYNRMFDPSDDHLRLLLSYGLGTGSGGPWYARFPTALPSPAEMLQDQLLWAAERNHGARARLLLGHGVDPDGLGFWFTGDDKRTAYQRAVRSGNTEIADMLLAAGARRPKIDPAHELVSACLSVDRPKVEELLAGDPSLLPHAIAGDRAAILRAAELGRAGAVTLLAELGFDVNAVRRITALHQAASAGDLALVELLLSLGADPNSKDREFDATPLGWAQHGQHPHVVQRLSPITDIGPAEE